MSVIYTEMQDRVAIVTGGAGGLGRAVAHKLGESGASLFIADAVRDGIDGVIRELRAKNVKTAGCAVDVRDPGSVQAMVDACMAAFGRVDYLITCAGIFTHSLVEDMPFKTWQDTIDINLTGTFLCIRKTAPEMLRAGFGRIVTFGSQSGVRGGVTHVHYGATKGGVMSMTRAFMREVADRNIRINCVSPGLILTPLTSDNLAAPEKLDAVRKSIPMGRMGEPREVANVVAFLLSEESSFMTGQTINVTGGAIVNT